MCSRKKVNCGCLVFDRSKVECSASSTMNNPWVYCNGWAISKTESCSHQRLHNKQRHTSVVCKCWQNTDNPSVCFFLSSGFYQLNRPCESEQMCHNLIHLVVSARCVSCALFVHRPTSHLSAGKRMLLKLIRGNFRQTLRYKKKVWCCYSMTASEGWTGQNNKQHISSNSHSNKLWGRRYQIQTRQDLFLCVFSAVISGPLYWKQHQQAPLLGPVFLGVSHFLLVLAT